MDMFMPEMNVTGDITFNGKNIKNWRNVYALRSRIGVVFPLPVGLHREWVVKAAMSGKHVICEKSLAESFDSVKEMVRACRENKVVLYENFMCSYHPQHGKVRSMISGGRIGEVFLFRGFFGCPPFDEGNIRYQKQLGGGSLNDVGTYPLFMSRKILKSEPLFVTCSLYSGKGQDVDTQGSAYLEFPGNKAALIAFGFNNLYQNDYSVWGSTGLVNVNRAYSIPADMKPQVELLKQDAAEKIDLPAANHFTLIFEDFCSKILENKACDYSPLLAQARAMEALRVSSREKRKVRVSEIR